MAAVAEAFEEMGSLGGGFHLLTVEIHLIAEDGTGHLGRSLLVKTGNILRRADVYVIDGDKIAPSGGDALDGHIFGLGGHIDNNLCPFVGIYGDGITDPDEIIGLFTGSGITDHKGLGVGPPVSACPETQHEIIFHIKQRGDDVIIVRHGMT